MRHDEAISHFSQFCERASKQLKNYEIIKIGRKLNLQFCIKN